MTNRYAETIDLLYTSFTFQVDHPKAVYEFVTMVPMVRLNSIKRLQVLWTIDIPKYLKDSPEQTAPGWVLRKLQGEERKWLRCCKIIKNMEGLQDLRIRLFKHIRTKDLNEKRILKTLTGVHVQKSYVLELPFVTGWKEGDGLVGAKPQQVNLPYTIERREKLGDGHWGGVRFSGVGQIEKIPLWLQGAVHLAAALCTPPIVVVYLGNKTVVKLQEHSEQRRRKKIRLQSQ